jgi:hypothetical protein
MSAQASDREWEFYQKNNEAAIENTGSTLRTLVLINGGAAVALLAFAGALVAQGKTSAVEQIAFSLLFFAGGVFFATVAMGEVYLVHFSIAAKTREQITNPNAPAWQRWWRWSTVWRVLAHTAALFSMLLFVCGVFHVKAAVTHLKNRPLSASRVNGSYAEKEGPNVDANAPADRTIVPARDRTLLSIRRRPARLPGVATELSGAGTDPSHAAKAPVQAWRGPRQRRRPLSHRTQRASDKRFGLAQRRVRTSRPGGNRDGATCRTVPAIAERSTGDLHRPGTVLLRMSPLRPRR